jgi:uncharacterized membrane protein YkoI
MRSNAGTVAHGARTPVTRPHVALTRPSRSHVVGGDHSHSGLIRRHYGPHSSHIERSDQRMTDKLKKIVAGVAVLAALGLGGAALAGATSGGHDSADSADAGDSEGAGSISSTDAARARDAAAAETGGKPGHIERDGEKGATYEVEVSKADGTQFDVRLDDQFKVVAVDPDGD